MSAILWLLGGLLLVSFGFIVLRGAPYVPTHRKQLNAAFTELYKLTSKDTIVDLGSGDGVVLYAALKRGAGAIGYELNPFLVLVSKLRLRAYKKAQVYIRDYLLVNDLPKDTTMVYAFTTSHNIEQIGRKLEQWAAKKQLYFISYGFRLKDKEPIKSEGPMHLYLFEPAQA